MSKEIVKAALRRLVRNFTSAFLVAFLVVFYQFPDWQIVNAAFLASFGEGIKSMWALVAYPAIIGGMFAGVTSAAKLIRDILRENGYEEWAAKIPF